MFKRVWRMRDRGLFLNFLASYLIVLILPIVVIGSVIYGRILKQLEGEVRNSNQMMLRQASRVMDLRMQELGLLAGQISQNARVRDFLFHPGEGPSEILKMMSLFKEIGIFQAPNRFIYDLVIYSFKADVLVSQQARYTPDFFYDEIAHPVGVTYEQWLAQLHRQHYCTSFALDYLTPDGLRERYVTYLRSLPTNEGLPAGTLIAYIEGRQIRQLFAPLVDGRQGVAFVIDPAGGVLVSTGEVPRIKWEFPPDRNFVQRNIGGKNMVINYERSEITSWYYVSMVPARLFNAEVSAIRSFMLIVLLLCLLVGVGMGAIMSWRNYRPIRAILDVLRPLRTKPFGRSQDELAMIMESAQEAMRENRNLRSYLEQNEALVRSNLLRRLLYGRIPPAESAEAFRTLCGVADAACAVMVVDVENFAEQPGDATKGIMVLAATEGIQRLLSCSVTEMEDERLAVLLALATGRDSANTALQAAREIQGVLDRNYQIPVSIGLSVAQGVENVPSAFREAIQAADYKIIKGHSTITAFSEIPQSDNSYYYPLDWERQLINHVKTGDYETVSAMVDEVYAENFTRRSLPVSLIRYAFYDLYGTALKVLHELNLNERDVLGTELSADQWLSQTDTASEMRDKLKLIYQHICLWITGRRESHNTLLKEEIISTLKQNYADPNLGLGLLAGRIQVSSSYLCRFFKDQTGYNFADYLNRLRVERAKHLLKNEELTVGEVATAVGYLSANTFIRIFKKYEGITPGQFRGGNDGHMAG